MTSSRRWDELLSPSVPHHPRSSIKRLGAARCRGGLARGFVSSSETKRDILLSLWLFLEGFKLVSIPVFFFVQDRTHPLPRKPALFDLSRPWDTDIQDGHTTSAHAHVLYLRADLDFRNGFYA